MGEKASAPRESKYPSLRSTAGAGVGIGAVYWVLESAIDSHVFGEASFVERLLAPDPNEIWMRLIIGSILVGFALYAHFVMKERRRSEQEICRAIQSVVSLAKQHRTAMEVQETLTQGYVAVIFELEAVERALSTDDDTGREYLLRAKNMARQNLEKALQPRSNLGDVNGRVDGVGRRSPRP